MTKTVSIRLPDKKQRGSQTKMPLRGTETQTRRQSGSSQPLFRTGFLRKGLYGLLLLSLLTPVVYSEGSFFGFVAVRNLYFRGIVECMAILCLFLPESKSGSGSWIGISVLLFLLVTGFAALAGVDPVQSFYSGFMRMEGFVGYIHLGLYAWVVARLQLSLREWNWLIIASIVVSLSVIGVGYGSPTGWLGDHYRFVGTLGQPAFLSVYLLIHVALVVYIGICADWIPRKIRLVAALLTGLILIWGLSLAGARSGIIGLLAAGIFPGLFVIWSRYRSVPLLVAVAGFVVAGLAGGYWLMAHTQVFQEVPGLGRLTNLTGSNNTLSARQITNRMAFDSFTERPLLGWGPENYSYAFPKNYNPALVAGDATEWYDRVHCVPLEWAFSAGVFGLLAYLLIWITFTRRLMKLPAGEASLGAVGAGYFVFNLLNPDNLAGAQFFFLIAGYLGGQPDNAARYIKFGITGRWLLKAVMGGIVLVLGYITVNAGQTLNQLNSQVRLTNGFERMNNLKATYESARTGRYEVADIVVDFAISVLQEPGAPPEAKTYCYEQAMAIMENQLRGQDGYGRLYLRLASLHSAAGKPDLAVKSIQQAITLDGPNRPATWMLLGDAYLARGWYDRAIDSYRQAGRRQPLWELPVVMEAYAAALKRDVRMADRLLKQLSTRTLIEQLGLVKQVYQQLGDLRGFVIRIAAVPEGERFMLTRPVYREWIFTSFDLGLIPQAIAGLTDFDRHFSAYHTEYSPEEIKALVAGIRQGVRPDKLTEISNRLPVNDYVPEW